MTQETLRKKENAEAKGITVGTTLTGGGQTLQVTEFVNYGYNMVFSNNQNVAVENILRMVESGSVTIK